MNNTQKQHILNEIRRTAEENNGIPLGQKRFTDETWIKTYDWMKFWSKFSDPVMEAWYKANSLNEAFSDDYIIQKYIKLIQELGHFPSTWELHVKSNTDPEFPSKNTMRKIGAKKDTAIKIRDYAENKCYHDIVKICEDVIWKSNHEKKNDNIWNGKVNIGEVYLFKSGRYYKIGKSNDTVRRGKELRIQLPEECILIHSIFTDDPSGIEAYWHRRFDSKRMQGEWFDLNSSDIKAFKRWKKII